MRGRGWSSVKRPLCIGLAAFLMMTTVVTGVGAANFSVSTYTIVTNIDIPNQFLLSVQLNRAVVIGEATGTNQGDSVELIDTSSHVVLTHVQVEGATAAAIDEHRKVLYVIGGGKRVNYFQWIELPSLWAISTTTGRILSKKPIKAFPYLSNRSQLMVAPDTGYIFDVITKPTRGQSEQVGEFAPTGARLHVADLPPYTTVMQDVIDSTRHRLIFELTATPSTYPGSATPPAIIVGVDTRSGAIVWKQPLDYTPTRVSIQPGSGQIWILAPGGRVTTLDTAKGRTVRIFHLTSPISAGAYPTGITVDDAHQTAFVFWCSANAGFTPATAKYGAICKIERLNEQTGTRMTLASRALAATFPDFGGEPPYALPSLLQLSMGHNMLVLIALGSPAGTNINFYDEQTGKLVDVMALTAIRDPAQIVPTACDREVCLMAVAGSVSSYNDTTGATSAGGVILLGY